MNLQIAKKSLAAMGHHAAGLSERISAFESLNEKFLVEEEHLYVLETRVSEFEGLV